MLIRFYSLDTHLSEMSLFAHSILRLSCRIELVETENSFFFHSVFRTNVINFREIGLEKTRPKFLTKEKPRNFIIMIIVREEIEWFACLSRPREEVWKGAWETKLSKVNDKREKHTQRERERLSGRVTIRKHRMQSSLEKQPEFYSIITAYVNCALRPYRECWLNTVERWTDKYIHRNIHKLAFIALSLDKAIAMYLFLCKSLSSRLQC